jgi:hypothetical protein
MKQWFPATSLQMIQGRKKKNSRGEILIYVFLHLGATQQQHRETELYRGWKKKGPNVRAAEGTEFVGPGTRKDT